MFWKRGAGKDKDRDAAAASAGARAARSKPRGVRYDDDIATLQKEFGITPVSDKDVEAEIQQLMGASACWSPQGDAAAQILDELHCGDDDDDEAAKILKELNVTGDLDGIDLGDEEEEADRASNNRAMDMDAMLPVAPDGAARQRMQVRSVGSARAPASRMTADADAPASSPGGSDAQAEQLAMLKRRAVELQRAGQIQEAIAVLRQVDAMEAGKAGPTANGTAAAPSKGAGAAADMGARVGTKRAAADIQSDNVVESYLPPPVDDMDVEVTDDDMQNPEYLAELAAMGFQDVHNAPAEIPEESIETVEAEMHEARVQAVRLKQMNRKSEAVGQLRKAKELEAKLVQMRAAASNGAAAARPAAPAMQALPVASDGLSSNGASVAAAPITSNGNDISRLDRPLALTDLDEEPQVEVTDDDLNDPAWAQELQKLGFAGEDVAAPPPSSQSRFAAEPAPDDTCGVDPNATRSFKSMPSIDPDDLIDEFEEDSDQEDGFFARSSRVGSATTTTSEFAAAPMVAPAAASTAFAAPPQQQVEPQVAAPTGFSLDDLQAQLHRAKMSALDFKRAGNTQAAVDMMRRVKQIENLIALKQQQSQVAAPVVPVLSAAEQLRAQKFDELEHLLVRFGNFAGAQAKEQVAVDRAKSAEWLARYKTYQAELQQLQQRRVLVGQDPPTYRIETLSEQVEVVDATVPHDEFHISIISIHGLQQVANKDVFVKFCLNFPSSSPYEGRTGNVRISPQSPFAGQLPTANAFRYKLQRSRGALRVFGIKKAMFEVWRVGTILRNPELVARGYQELEPLLSVNHVNAHVPFVGSNRKPIGGDVEISMRIRTPLRDTEYRTVVTQVLHVDPYPEIVHVTPVVSLESSSARLSMTSTTRLSMSASTRLDMSASTRVSMSASTMRMSRRPIAPQPARSPPPPAKPALPPVPAQELADPMNPDLIVSYDVISEEITKLEAKLPSLSGDVAIEAGDRYDSLALKKQILEINIETGKLTMETYLQQVRARISADNNLLRHLMQATRRKEAAQVLHRVKVMQKEVQGAESAQAAT